MQPGDTLSGIAARLAVHGGWPALYTPTGTPSAPTRTPSAPAPCSSCPAGRPPPATPSRPGTPCPPSRPRLRVPGGWPALYAANRQAIGPDPDVIHPGTMLTSRPAPRRRPGPPRATPATRAPPPPPPAAGPRTSPARDQQPAPAAPGMPQWLKTMLLAVGLLVLAALLAEPVLRSPPPARSIPQPRRPARPPAPPAGHRQAGPGPPRLPSAETACIVLADHDRLVVTCNKQRRHGLRAAAARRRPRAILRVARLVLPEGPYGELARQLGMPAIGPVE